MKVVRKGIPASFTRTMQDMRRMHVEVGIFPEASYPDGTPVAYVAAINEFGYPQGGIPARSFFRPTVTDKRIEWGQQFAGAMVGAIKGQIVFADALEGIGAMAAGDIGRTISQITEPALKESTLRIRRTRKKNPSNSDKPLIDSGTMGQAVAHKVESK